MFRGTPFDLLDFLNVGLISIGAMGQIHKPSAEYLVIHRIRSRAENAKREADENRRNQVE
jgi:hypothetical protein